MKTQGSQWSSQWQVSPDACTHRFFLKKQLLTQFCVLSTANRSSPARAEGFSHQFVSLSAAVPFARPALGLKEKRGQPCFKLLQRRHFLKYNNVPQHPSRTTKHLKVVSVFIISTFFFRYKTVHCCEDFCSILRPSLWTCHAGTKMHLKSISRIPKLTHWTLSINARPTSS